MPTIRKRNGQWQVQVRLSGHAPAAKTFQHHKDAQDWGLETERRLKLHGMPVSRKELERTTLSELIQRYCDQRLHYKKCGANEKVMLTAFTKREPSLCKKSLATISPQDFVRYRDERVKEIKSSTLRRELAPLRHMFEVARREWSLSVENPLRGLWLPAEPPHRERRLRDGEKRQLSEAVLKCRGLSNQVSWNSILDLVLTTAMRRGEMLGLSWTDIDFDKRTIAVRHSKSGKIRILPMSLSAAPSLKMLRVLSRRMTDEGVTGTRLLNDVSRRVIPLSPSAFEQSWRRIVKRAGIDGLTFHDLRHEAACRFDELGLTHSETQYMLGHAKKDMTSRYIHADLERIRAKLNEPAYDWYKTRSDRLSMGLQIRGDEQPDQREQQELDRVRLKKHFNGKFPEKGSDQYKNLSMEEILYIALYAASDRAEANCETVTGDM